MNVVFSTAVIVVHAVFSTQDVDVATSTDVVHFSKVVVDICVITDVTTVPACAK